MTLTLLDWRRRTGTLYAYEQYGIEPDILATAKGIGGGFPLGACLATEAAASGMVIGTHGSTYGGNPLAMAAGMAVLDVVAQPEFLAHVREIGERLFVSRNTVSSEVGAIYRKLGVSSRNEAVERATEIGLLGA